MKLKKILCLKEKLTVILEKLTTVNNKIISLNENGEDNESTNEIYFEQNSRFLNNNEIIENHISWKRPSLSSKSIP